MKHDGENCYSYYNTDELEHEVLLPREVMNYLGCGRNTFFKLVQSGTLPAFRVGKQWRVSREKLKEFTQER